ncbi:MAG: hypothetical protein QOK37_3113 [Thermoanaerobaculia bacterium]|jgi:hypothetical protein|nr:hypothetical protein [Thermoanaerobaculia bacterium]
MNPFTPPSGELPKTNQEEEKRRRSELKIKYAALFASFAEILFRLDPAGINFEVNPDEYEPEVGTILPRVIDVTSAEEIVPVLREEFFRWFGGIKRPGIEYEEMAAELFEAIQRQRRAT